MNTNPIDEVRDYTKYSESEVKNKNKFQKLMVVGLTGLAIISAINVGMGAMLQNDTNALLQLSGNQRSQIVQVIEQTNELGFKELYIPKYAPTGPVKHVRKYDAETEGKNVASFREDTAYYNTVSKKWGSENFNIHFSVPSDRMNEIHTMSIGDVSRIGESDFSHENYRNVTKSNGAEWNVNNMFDAVTLIAKMDIASNPELYQVFKDDNLNALFSKVEQKDYFNSAYNSTFGGAMITNNAGAILENGYTEAVAIILTSRSDLASKENFLDKRMVSTLFARNNVFNDVKSETVALDVYAVHEYARTPEIQQKIQSVKSAEDIRELATDMAHHNFKQVVASKNSDAFYNDFRLKREAFDSFLNNPINRGTTYKESFWSDVASDVAKNFSQKELYELSSSIRSAGGTHERTENVSSKIPEYSLKNAFARVGDINKGSAEYKTLQVALQDLVKDVQVTKAFDIKPNEIKDTDMAQNVIKINKDFIAQKKEERANNEISIMQKVSNALKIG